MSDVDRKPNDPQGTTWIQRTLQKLQRPARGDTIAGHVSGGATGVTIGKNIVQIGTLTIPVWLLALVAIGLVLVVVATSLPLIERWLPQRMGDGLFNIAVAEFNAVDAAGREVDTPEAYDLSQSIANFLEGEKETLRQFIGERVDIWGPDKGISPVDETQEEARAKALNADALIYGVLEAQDEERWLVYPRFFLTDKAVGQADELRGAHNLGARISYRSQNIASKEQINNQLRIRTKALSQMLSGLSHLALGEIQGYKRAAEIFSNIANESEWGRAADGTGQEVLYLFLGNAYLAQATLTDDESPDRADLLTKSRDAFTTAISLEADYARSYNGLASALFQQARPLVTEAECDWDWDLLNEAERNYAHATNLPASAKPPSGHVDYRANFGLARVYFWKGYCQDAALWDEAQTYYEAVADAYAQMEEPIAPLTEIAAYAHTDLASMALVQATAIDEQGDSEVAARAHDLLTDAIEHYAGALELAELARTDEMVKQVQVLMPYYLTALCLAGQGETAETVLNESSANWSNPESIRSEILALIDSTLWQECSDTDAS